MKNEYVTVRNTATRKVGVVRRRIAESKVLGKGLEIVADGSKDIVTYERPVFEAETYEFPEEDTEPIFKSKGKK